MTAKHSLKLAPNTLEYCRIRDEIARMKKQGKE